MVGLCQGCRGHEEGRVAGAALGQQQRHRGVQHIHQENQDHGGLRDVVNGCGARVKRRTDMAPLALWGRQGQKHRPMGGSQTS